jgi:hypothetical protein
MVGPGARAVADWLIYLSAREHVSFHELAIQYLHVRLLCFDGMMPTVYDAERRERVPAAAVRDYAVSFHTPTQGILIKVSRRCVQQAVRASGRPAERPRRATAH